VDALELSAVIVLALFAVFYLNSFLGGALNAFGILPRNAWGLAGILFSPLLHYNLAHLTTNALSLFVLLVILFSHREYNGRATLAWIWFFSGLGTWLIGRAWSGSQPIVHIGASGVIYGVVTYLIAAAWYLRSWRAAFWALLIFFLYGGIFFGVLPRRGFISWEGHLSGVITGFFVARLQK
jgi:membrane associated rhomboid family serine protease